MKKKTTPKQSPSKKKKLTAAPAAPRSSFYVVGIGASAGGLETLERFFRKMPESIDMAFIVVSHLDPNHVSIMPELIQKSTPMKVFQAADGMAVEPNHVYVAPANRDLTILHGTIQLLEPLEPHGFRLPIDSFFRSLARDFGENAICIILSGMASDGTDGLKAVKSELGMVMVQSPTSAKFDSMPNNAIKTGMADFILPPEEMPATLINYIAHKVRGGFADNVFADGKDFDAFQKIFILLRNHTGQDFSLYKHNTIYRRVQRRMNITQIEHLTRYIRFLQNTPAEVNNLFRELLIGVTHFFRDPESFVKLKKLLGELVKNKPDNGYIRIWVPGCSTGEEAYSIAILLRECMNDAKKSLNVQIFATDIDPSAIEKARAGVYTGFSADVSKERLNRYFTFDNDLFRIRKEIREMLVFAQHSIIKDPPFTKLDLISCRNLLIYFNAELQKRTIPFFHYSLVPNGILFLGSSETISGFVDLFSIVDSKWKMYRRRESIYSAQPFLGNPMRRTPGKSTEVMIKKTEVKNIARLGEQIVLQSYAPNCVIVTEHGEFAYIHGKTGKYLELTHGEAKMNVFEMAREGLRQELPPLMRKAVSSKKISTAKGVRIKSGRGAISVNLTVKPITEPEEMRGSLLIIFEEDIAQQKSTSARITHHGKKSEATIKELERELKSTKDNLRSTIEELESSNEELKSTNEEMQSTNEEMQSSNEELETSKEELQSLNEELITVNTELQSKNDELSVSNDDVKNLMESIDIPTIFLDNNFFIKKFTFHATKVIHLIPSDIGRPINHIATNLKYEKLIDDAKEVLRTLVQKSVELQTNEGLWYQMRILPYRTTNNVIDGVVITFSDINAAKAASEKIGALGQDIQLAREYAENVIDTVRESLLILDKEMKVVSANRSFYKMFHTSSAQTVGISIYQLDGNAWNIPKLRELLEKIIPERNIFEDFEVEYNSARAGRKTLLLNARQIVHRGTETKLILLAMQDKNIS
jgi:two-component system CheB/CheR fusion protein